MKPSLTLFSLPIGFLGEHEHFPAVATILALYCERFKDNVPFLTELNGP